mgnify:CR=1 FL=1
MKKCLNDYIQEVANFAEVRGWENEDPNELLTSTVIELGELAEHYQWQKEFKKKYTEREKKEIGYEFVDVFSIFLESLDILVLIWVRFLMKSTRS